MNRLQHRNIFAQAVVLLVFLAVMLAVYVFLPEPYTDAVKSAVMGGLW